MTESREQEARVRAAVLGLIDTIDVPPDSGELPRRVRRGRRRALLSGVAAAVVLLLVVVAMEVSGPRATCRPDRAGRRSPPNCRATDRGGCRNRGVRCQGSR